MTQAASKHVPFEPVALPLINPAMSTNSENSDSESSPPDAVIAEDCQEVSIRVAARMTGLPADTLRVWERRYAFPSPRRDSAGNRIYSIPDIERLNLVRKAMKLGYRAGAAIREPIEKLERLVSNAQVGQRNDDCAEDVADPMGLVAIFRSRDLSGLRQRIRQIVGRLGAQRFVVQVASPLIDAVGRERSLGELRLFQEQLVLGVLSDELRLLQRLHAPTSGPRLLLAALPHDRDVIGLELAGLIASLAGASVEFLSPDLPSIEIVDAAIALRVEALMLSISNAISPTAATAQVAWLEEHLPAPIGLWLGGKAARSLEDLPSRVRIIGAWQELEGQIRGLRSGL